MAILFSWLRIMSRSRTLGLLGLTVIIEENILLLSTYIRSVRKHVSLPTTFYWSLSFFDFYIGFVACVVTPTHARTHARVTVRSVFYQIRLYKRRARPKMVVEKVTTTARARTHIALHYGCRSLLIFANMHAYTHLRYEHVHRLSA